MRRWLPELLLTLALVVLAALSASIGSSHMNPFDIFSPDPALHQLAATVMVQIRLPRTILAILAGASLGLSGAVLQGLLRNPLADPGIVGISASAALGAVVAFYFGLWSVAGGGIAGALIGLVILGTLAGRNAGTLTLILAGLALSSCAIALTSLALNLAPSPLAAYEIMTWLLGSVADRSWVHVWTALPCVLAGWMMLLMTGRGLSALTLGGEVAHSLGVDLRRLQFFALTGTALSVGASVAVVGSVGFVGLIMPHLLRRWVGHDPARLLPVSLLGGAVLLLAADIVIRVCVVQQELKLGVVTALIGAPFFLVQVLRLRRDA
jgi:iron complex transport system permease protein